MTSTFPFAGIGTTWEVVTDLPLNAALRGFVLDRVNAFDAVWSRFRTDSLVSRLACEGGEATFPREARRLFDLYDRLHVLTDGAVDPLVGRDLELLGYDADYSLRPASREAFTAHHTGRRRRWSTDIHRAGVTVTVAEPTLIDVGAAGKGLLVDVLGDLLEDEGIRGSLIDGGGDMRQRGSGHVRVGLEHPLIPSYVVGVVELRDGSALCASSTAKRAWGPGLHHVLDGRTGRPVTGVVGTWVVAADAMTADGLATALFSTPAEQLAGHFDFASARMHVDGRLETWGDFPGEIFSSGNHRPFATTASRNSQ